MQDIRLRLILFVGIQCIVNVTVWQQIEHEHVRDCRLAVQSHVTRRNRTVTIDMLKTTPRQFSCVELFCLRLSDYASTKVVLITTESVVGERFLPIRMTCVCIFNVWPSIVSFIAHTLLPILDVVFCTDPPRLYVEHSTAECVVAKSGNVWKYCTRCRLLLSICLTHSS